MCIIRVQLIKVAAHAHTSCINFEKCYFSELTIYFAEDESGSLAMAKKRVSRAARRWNKTAAGKVEVEEQLFSKTPTAAFGCARTSFSLYVHVHISSAQHVECPNQADQVYSKCKKKISSNFNNILYINFKRCFKYILIL